MPAVDELFEQARSLPPKARKELRDKIDASLRDQASTAPASDDEEPYASLLRLAGTAHSTHPDVSTNKNKHLAEIYSKKLGAK